MRALTILLTAAVALAAAASSASAQGLYAGGQLGIGDGGGEFANSGFDLELAAGPVIGGFIGKEIDSIRIEGELTYRHNDMDSIVGFPVAGEMSSTALMGNVYYDFGDRTDFTPYLGIGLGVANITFDSAAHDTDIALALQIMAGGAFPVTDSTAMTVDLRIFGASAQFTDSVGMPFEQEYGITSLMMGFRTSF